MLIIPKIINEINKTRNDDNYKINHINDIIVGVIDIFES